MASRRFGVYIYIYIYTVYIYIYIHQIVRFAWSHEGAQVENLQPQHDFTRKTIALAAGVSLRDVIVRRRPMAKTLLFASGSKMKFETV